MDSKGRKVPTTGGAVGQHETANGSTQDGRVGPT